jgi:hypothetical protein
MDELFDTQDPLSLIRTLEEEAMSDDLKQPSELKVEEPAAEMVPAAPLPGPQSAAINIGNLIDKFSKTSVRDMIMEASWSPEFAGKQLECIDEFRADLAEQLLVLWWHLAEAVHHKET